MCSVSPCDNTSRSHTVTSRHLCPGAGGWVAVAPLPSTLTASSLPFPPCFPHPLSSLLAPPPNRPAPLHSPVTPHSHAWPFHLNHVTLVLILDSPWLWDSGHCWFLDPTDGKFHPGSGSRALSFHCHPDFSVLQSLSPPTVVLWRCWKTNALEFCLNPVAFSQLSSRVWTAF